MCGRYFRRSDKQRLAEAFRLGQISPDFVLPPDYNVAPTSEQPVVVQSSKTGERELVTMRWSFVPFHTKELRELKAYSLINARAEGILRSNLWGEAFRRRRCLIPADGFYEWKRPDAKTRLPWVFTVIGREPLAMAGIWDRWRRPDGTWLHSYAVVTTDANEVMEPVHSRMPVIVEPKDYERWLDRDSDPERPPVDLLRPLPDEEMSSRPVGQAVNNVRNNWPELLDNV